MGTNMGMYAERRLDEHWHFLGKMKNNPFYEGHPERERPTYPESIYDTLWFSRQWLLQALT